VVKLNQQQKAAIRYLDGPLLVIAGAGSGKTRVITEKISYLIQECGYSAQHIFAVTFTNKAAQEMKVRIRDRLPPATRRGLHIATFHTLGLSILKRDPSASGLKNGFSIFDAEDALGVLRSLMTAATVPDKDTLFRIQAHISSWKNGQLTPTQVHQLTPTDIAFEHAVALYPRYQHALRAYNAVDFDDLIALPVQLLAANASHREYWQSKIRYLLVDEYQDSNAAQYALVQYLLPLNAALTVVGDDDQSIYAWRGAKPENLMQLMQDYPQLNVIKLEQNYRSMGYILQAANHLIGHNPRLVTKNLWSELGPGDLLRVLSCQDEEDEASQVIGDLIGHKMRTGSLYSDYAILYRSNHQARVFEAALRQQGIPYSVSGGQSWFARTEVKDFFAYVKLLCNPADDAAFLRIINTPKRGIGPTTLAALGQYASARGESLYMCCDHMALMDQVADAPRAALLAFKQVLERYRMRCESSDTMATVLRELVEEIGYESYIYEQCESPAQAQKRMQHVWELVDWIERLLEKKELTTLSDVVNRLMLIDRLEQSDDDNQQAVQLMTLHASKGLEFTHVYLVGLEEGLLPHHASLDEELIPEERRLLYVGITRAQRTLCLTLAARRRRAREWTDCLPSRFLTEIPADLLVWHGQGVASDAQQATHVANNHLASLRHMLAGA
jgi:ATP-dependent DNA helicase Rep